MSVEHLRQTDMTWRESVHGVLQPVPPLRTPQAAAAHGEQSVRPPSDHGHGMSRSMAPRSKICTPLHLHLASHVAASSKPEGGCLETFKAARRTSKRTFSLYLNIIHHQLSCRAGPCCQPFIFDSFPALLRTGPRRSGHAHCCIPLISAESS